MLTLSLVASLAIAEPASTPAPDQTDTNPCWGPVFVTSLPSLAIAVPEDAHPTLLFDGAGCGLEGDWELSVDGDVVDAGRMGNHDEVVNGGQATFQLPTELTADVDYVLTLISELGYAEDDLTFPFSTVAGSVEPAPTPIVSITAEEGNERSSTQYRVLATLTASDLPLDTWTELRFAPTDVWVYAGANFSTEHSQFVDTDTLEVCGEARTLDAAGGASEWVEACTAFEVAIVDEEPFQPIESEKKGCSCSTSPTLAGWFVFLLPVLFHARRRR